MITQPSLATLTARFLANREVSTQVDSAVEPHEVASAFVTDPKSAWMEAIAVAKLLGVKDSVPMPSDWAGYVRQAGGADYLPMCLGNFPQQVSDVSSLISGKRATAPTTTWTAQPTKLPILTALLNATAARGAGHFANAEKHLAEAEQLANTDSLKTLVKNERGALAHAKGDTATARKLWTELSATAMGAFNLGILAMQTPNKSDAKKHFSDAASRLPESSSWHHLAKMYVALS